jgi:hypothetical protein
MPEHEGKKDNTNEREGPPTKKKHAKKRNEKERKSEERSKITEEGGALAMDGLLSRYLG